MIDNLDVKIKALRDLVALSLAESVPDESIAPFEGNFERVHMMKLLDVLENTDALLVLDYLLNNEEENN